MRTMVDLPETTFFESEGMEHLLSFLLFKVERS